MPADADWKALALVRNQFYAGEDFYCFECVINNSTECWINVALHIKTNTCNLLCSLFKRNQSLLTTLWMYVSLSYYSTYYRLLFLNEVIRPSQRKTNWCLVICEGLKFLDSQNRLPPLKSDPLGTSREHYGRGPRMCVGGSFFRVVNSLAGVFWAEAHRVKWNNSPDLPTFLAPSNANFASVCL